MKEFTFHTVLVTERSGIVKIQAETLGDALNSLRFNSGEFREAGGLKNQSYINVGIYQVDGKDFTKGSVA